MSETHQDQEFELSGGALCLDFANTLGDRPHGESEHLSGYSDILRFVRQAEALPASDIDDLEHLATDCDACVEPIFKRAIELREALYRIFSGCARHESPAAADVELLNAALTKAFRQLELEASGFDAGRPVKLTWSWGGPAQALDRPLWPVLRSAAELLTSDEVGNIRECDSDTCSWLFIDRSRNRRRRWCDMSTCGNRAKARRHYRRSKRTASTPVRGTSARPMTD